MADSPKDYKVEGFVMSSVWVALYESGQEDLAHAISDIMIQQGCQELIGTEDPAMLLAFWRGYMEDRGMIYTVPEPEEVN